MVATRVRHHAAVSRFIVEDEHRVERAPELERSGGLEALGLQYDTGGAEGDQRRAQDESPQPRCGGGDLVGAHEIVRHGLPESRSR